MSKIRSNSLEARGAMGGQYMRLPDATARRSFARWRAGPVSRIRRVDEGVRRRPAPGLTSTPSVRRSDNKFLGYGLDLRGADRGLLLGVADKQSQVAKAVDPPRHAVREMKEGFDGIVFKDRPRR